MGADIPPPTVDEGNETVQATENRNVRGKNKGKVPKRIHKAEREKMKREQLNELFLELASALELTQPNNGKASVLCETTRLLKDMIEQIECLKKENDTLLSESHYVTAEKNELKEENAVLESQIEGLQKELENTVALTKPDLNVPPPEFQQPDFSPQFPGEALGLPSANTTVRQPPTVIVLPIHPNLQPYQVSTSNVSKPHARYPTPADTWPSQLLGEQLAVRKEVQ